MRMHEVAERAVARCRDSDACVAIADETAVAHLRWAGSRLTTNGFTRSRRLTVIAVCGEAVGVVAREGDLTASSITELVRAAERRAREAGPAPDYQPLLSGESRDWTDPPAETSFSSLPSRLANAFERDALFYGYAEHQVRTTYLASSTGLRLRHAQPTAILDLTGKTPSASAWTGTSATDFSAIDPGAMAEEVLVRLAWAKRRIELPAGRYEVLLPPSAVADLMLNLYQSASAIDAVGGATVFSAPNGGTRVGERLTATPLTLYGDPAEPGLECAPFTVARASGAASSVFDNGIPLARTNWITDGVVTALPQTRYSARETGLRHTPEIDNLILTGATSTLDELIAGTRQGLLLTSLWYLREVDPRTLLLTGLTRDGVFLVEDGEIAGAVPDFRFNESPVALLARVSEVGRSERTLPREWGDYFTRMAMPTLRVSDFASAGQA